MISNDEIAKSSDILSIESDASRKQVKLTDMIVQMKAPSAPKKVELVLLKKGKRVMDETKNYIPEPSKAMTQQMIKLLDEVEAGNHNGTPKQTNKNNNMTRIISRTEIKMRRKFAW